MHYHLSNDDLGKCSFPPHSPPVFADADYSLMGLESNMDRSLSQLILHSCHLMQTEQHGFYSAKIVFITLTINSLIT